MACGLALAAVLREHPANITITKIDTARRTRIPLNDAVMQSEYVHGAPVNGQASLVLIPMEFALVAE